MTASQHTIAGTVLTMPIQIRTANLHSAIFSVPAKPAQRLIDYSGLTVFPHLPGRALLVQMLVHYLDGDLGSYHEYGTAIMVRPPGNTARSGRPAAFIHHLPVDQPFTLEAGRTIWGFPKIMADFDVRQSQQTGKVGFEVRADGQLIAGIEFSPGLRLPARGSQVLKTYSHRDGVTREIPWQMRISGLRARPGGARLQLGDHPYAKELAALGLPKRALASQSAANVAMTFGDAHVI